MEPTLLTQPILKRCLALTGAFETGKGAPDCFSGLAGDFDGMGLSFGSLQWNLGQKTLQPMLQEMFTRHGDVMSKVFGDGLNTVKYMLALPCAAQLEWALSIQNRVHHTIGEPWKARFLALGQTEEFQAIQMAQAESMYRTATAMCQRFGLTTERGLALMFDIRVQNGTITSAVESKIRADFHSLTSELPRLQSIANRRSEAANPKFIEDVRTRKLTVANGKGRVHGIDYDLETQFGIRLIPISEPPPISEPLT